MRWNMKTRFCVILWTIALLLAGCVRIEPIPAQTGDPEQEESALSVLCTGVYEDTAPDGTAEIARFYAVGDVLLCEVDEVHAAYYAEEIRPEDPSLLLAPVSSLPPDGIPVTVRRFSGFSNFGEYWDGGAAYRMEFTPEGVVFHAQDGGEDYARTRSGAEDSGIIGQKREELRSLLGTEPGPDPAPPVGSWVSGARTLVLREDGGILYSFREEGHPVRVYAGAYGIGPDGRLVCLTKRIGWADMPFEGSYRWALEDGNALVLRSDEAQDPILAEAEIRFTAAEVLTEGAF